MYHNRLWDFFKILTHGVQSYVIFMPCTDCYWLPEPRLSETCFITFFSQCLHSFWSLFFRCIALCILFLRSCLMYDVALPWSIKNIVFSGFLLSVTALELHTVERRAVSKEVRRSAPLGRQKNDPLSRLKVTKTRPPLQRVFVLTSEYERIRY